MSKHSPSQTVSPPQTLIAVLTAAAAWCPAVLLAGITGVLIAQGHDGLAYTLGIMAAAAVWAAVIVPAVSSRPDLTSIPAYLKARCASAAAGRVAASLLLVGLAGLLAAEVSIVEAVLRMFGQTNAALAVAIGIAAIGGLMAIKPHTEPFASLALIVVPVAVAVLIAALFALAWRDGPGALVSIPAMSEIAGLEQALLESRLADPAAFKPHAVPFLRVDALNFIGLVTCLAFGLAMLAIPRLDGAGLPSARPTRLAARAVLVLAGLLVLLPPLAAAAKRALLTLAGNGIKPSALPEWLAASLDAGAVQVCGASVRDAAALAKACGKGVGPQGFIRWQDVSFNPDALLFAALDASSPIAAPLKIAFTLAIVAAALWTARRIGLLASQQAPVLTSAGAAPLASVIAVVATASLIAFAKPAGAVTLLTWSASFAGAALAPAVLAAALTARPSAGASIVAMVAGAVVTLALIVAVRYAPANLFAWTGMAATASPAVVRKLAGLQDAYTAATAGPGKDALLAQVERLSRDSLSWFGIKPLASGIFGLALGLLIAVPASLARSLRRDKK